jgi:chromosome segregation ATPase
MIEMVMMKLGFSGMIALALAATLVGGSVVVKMRLASKDAKIAKLTDQVREVAQQRDALLNANRALTLSVQKQNDTIEGYVRAGQIQQQRADRATKEAQSVRERWEAYTRELEGEPDVQKAYDRLVAKWNRPDTAPSEVP